MNTYMVLDVESKGLHGQAFAWAFVVVDQQGTRLEELCASCSPSLAAGTPEASAWVEQNIPPIEVTYRSLRQLRDDFWESWQDWKSRGATLVADCGWPVESHFLNACVADEPTQREYSGPYPLLDLGSILVAHGKDPLQTFERLPDELPLHHPLSDARQSARILIETLHP